MESKEFKQLVKIMVEERKRRIWQNYILYVFAIAIIGLLMGILFFTVR